MKNFSEHNLAILQTALRFWQQSATDHRISSETGEEITISAKEVDDLCAVISAQDQPTAVLELNGGMIVRLNTNQPMRVVVLDQDTESGEASNIMEIGEEEYYVSDLHMDGLAEPGSDGIDVGYVNSVLEVI